MPGKRGSKAVHERIAKIRELSSNIRKTDLEILSLEETLTSRNNQILNLNSLISDKNNELELAQTLLNDLSERHSQLSREIIAIQKSNTKLSTTKAPSFKTKKPRAIKNSGVEVSEITMKRRRFDTWKKCKSIHGPSKDAIVYGLLDTLGGKCTSSYLAPKLLHVRSPVTKLIKESVLRKHTKDLYDSDENSLRSLNVYYCSNVLGKNKYMAIRKSIRKKHVCNLIPYIILAKQIRDIDIGELIPVQGTLDIGATVEEKGIGFYRNLKTYLPHLAKFYLTVNSKRNDKLVFYDSKDSGIKTFLLAIGGDEAPASGTAFLVSFLNAGKRVCSSFENFLIFAGNVKENGFIIQNYLKILISDLKYLESTTFSISVNDEHFNVKFKAELLPNDLKMLAFLAGELINKAHYFCTFANVNDYNSNKDMQFKLKDGSSKDWLPFKYSKRCDNAKLVETKKKQMIAQGFDMTTVANRKKVTDYIRSLGCRQEFKPPIGEYVDLAMAEPLHLKNNVCKYFFMNIWNVVQGTSKLNSVKTFKEIPEDNIVWKCVEFVRYDMRLNKLSKVLRQLYNDSAGKSSEFKFRFRGEESRKYLEKFPSLISMLFQLIENISYIDQDKWKKRLLVIFAQSIHLRKLISYAVRVKDFDINMADEMQHVGKKLFNLVRKYDRITPSVWILCIIAPVQSKQLYTKLNLGLGINTMEGREQKHQKIERYMFNATVKDRWPTVFRHEYVSCIYLRLNNFDDLKYKKKIVSYLPSDCTNFCQCNLMELNQCFLCNNEYFMSLME